MPRRKNDLPYLEPLLFHLRKDSELKTFFDEEGIFALPKPDQSDLERALKKDCPNPRAAWIFPGPSTPMQQGNTGCPPKIIHSFAIVVSVQCQGASFDFLKDNGEVYLDGSYMELCEGRVLIKESVDRFMCKMSKDYTKKFDNMLWTGDSIVWPSEEVGGDYIMTQINYSVNIY